MYEFTEIYRIVFKIGILPPGRSKIGMCIKNTETKLLLSGRGQLSNIMGIDVKVILVVKPSDKLLRTRIFHLKS